MTESRIQELYENFKVPRNIIAHMQKVAYVCSILADKFIEKGFEIDKNKLIQAALLHDVLRTIDIKPESLEKLANLGENPRELLTLWLSLKEKYKSLGHEKAMAEVLTAENETKLANLIGKHGFFEITNLKTLEEKILYYSDKRVDHDTIVTLENRFIEGRKRNMSKDDDFEQVQTLENAVFALEKELENLLGEKLPI